MTAALSVSGRAAKLPVNYVHAREALEKCERIDECKDWADKAAALASYAKQADDETLFNTAMRIKGRAVRRCGELLKKIEAKHTGRIGRDTPPNSGTRKAAASAAGLSRDQAKQALRVASVPHEQFESAIESDDPPTVTALAKQGKKPRPKPPDTSYLKGASPAEFNAAIHARGALEDLAPHCSKVTPAIVAKTATAKELEAMRKWISTVKPWIATLEKELGK